MDVVLVTRVEKVPKGQRPVAGVGRGSGAVCDFRLMILTRG
jgi:hypothetical protein